MRDEGIGAIVLAGDNVAVPLVRNELPKDIAARVVDVVKLDDHAPERQIVDATIESLRQKDAETDRERVEAVLGAYRAGGLAAVGVEPTLAALALGQVDELLITAVTDTIDPGKKRRAGRSQRAIARGARCRRAGYESAADRSENPLHRRSGAAGRRRRRGGVLEIQAVEASQKQLSRAASERARERVGESEGRKPLG